MGIALDMGILRKQEDRLAVMRVEQILIQMRGEMMRVSGNMYVLRLNDLLFIVHFRKKICRVASGLSRIKP